MKPTGILDISLDDATTRTRALPQIHEWDEEMLPEYTARGRLNHVSQRKIRTATDDKSTPAEAAKALASGLANTRPPGRNRRESTNISNQQTTTP
jgi:hypothetical protein